MRSAYLTLTLDSEADAERVYALLTDGGEIFMKMEQDAVRQSLRHASRQVRRRLGCFSISLKPHGDDKRAVSAGALFGVARQLC